MRIHLLTRRLAVPLGLVVLAGLAPGPAAAAIGWTSPVTIRTQNKIALQDADFAGRKVAATWQAPSGGSPSVGIRSSLNGGTSFGPVATFPDARQSAVEICGSEIEATYARKSGSNWGIERALGNAAAGAFSTHNVAVGPAIRRFPDIACAGGRVFVSWFEREVPGDRLHLSHAVREVGAFAFPIDLGKDDKTRFGRSLAVAGVNDTAYVVYALSDGRLRLRRYLIGAGPGFDVVPDPTVRVIAQGTADDSADAAVIAAAGSKVAVAWFRCNGIFAKVSNDKGLTWGPRRKLLSHVACAGDFGASPRSIAIRGGRIIVTYAAIGLGSPGWMGVITTKSDFASSKGQPITARLQDEHLVGFVTVGGRTKLAGVFDPGNRIRFRRQQ